MVEKKKKREQSLDFFYFILFEGRGGGSKHDIIYKCEMNVLSTLLLKSLSIIYNTLVKKKVMVPEILFPYHTENHGCSVLQIFPFY